MREKVITGEPFQTDEASGPHIANLQSQCFNWLTSFFTSRFENECKQTTVYVSQVSAKPALKSRFTMWQCCCIKKLVLWVGGGRVALRTPRCCGMACGLRSRKEGGGGVGEVQPQPVITAGKIIKQKVFPVRAPSGTASSTHSRRLLSGGRHLELFECASEGKST